MTSHINCPKCGAERTRDDSCAQCGVVYAKFRPYTPIGSGAHQTVRGATPAGALPATKPQSTNIWLLLFALAATIVVAILIEAYF